MSVSSAIYSPQGAVQYTEANLFLIDLNQFPIAHKESQMSSSLEKTQHRLNELANM